LTRACFAYEQFAVVDGSYLDPFLDQSKHAAVVQASFDHLYQCRSTYGIEVGADVNLQDPSHGSGTEYPAHFVQCLVLPTPGPKPIRAVEKILLVNGVQEIDRHFLHELILEGGNRDRPLFPILFGYIDSA
jgi:hypothetical protein